MNKIIKIAAAAITILAITAIPVLAAALSLVPWTYDPDNTGGVVAKAQGTSLRLEKNVPTPTNAAAGALIQGAQGMSTTNMILQFSYTGYCGAGAPRFNVNLTNGSTVFLGCIYGDPASTGIATFTAGNTYGGVLFPSAETIQSIDIVMDEQGQTTLSNVMVNDMLVNFSKQTLMDQCKKDGYGLNRHPCW